MKRFLKSIFIAAIITLPSGTIAKYCPDEDPEYYFSDRHYKLLKGTQGDVEEFCRSPNGTEIWDGFHHVVFGEIAEPGEFSFMCALGWPSAENSSSLDYKCGGTLISYRFLLTAAHCAYVNGISPVAVKVGGHNLTDFSTKIHYILSVIVHPDYDTDSVYHDIAIIQTKTPVYEAKLACLWTLPELHKETLTVIGYGAIKYAGSSSPALLKADLQAISNDECGNFHESDFQMTDGIIGKQLCAKDPEQLRDSCQGDSGGPLLMRKCQNSLEMPFIVGITSFGIGCAGEPPGIYTRVSEYIDWIKAIVWPPEIADQWRNEHNWRKFLAPPRKFDYE